MIKQNQNQKIKIALIETVWQVEQKSARTIVDLF
jgi:hypothetical protein